MARDAEIERRLQNWARWKDGAGQGGLGYATSDFSADGGGSGYREAVIPTIAAEAAVTDLAVQALDGEARHTVETYYLGEHGTDYAIAHELGISDRALRNRLARAHGLLARWLQDRADAQRAERERVESLQSKRGVFATFRK